MPNLLGLSVLGFVVVHPNTCAVAVAREVTGSRIVFWVLRAILGVFVDVNIATWMLWKNARSTLTWLPHGCCAKTDGVFVAVIRVATWMLCKTDGVFVDVNMVATWMRCKSGRSLCGD